MIPALLASAFLWLLIFTHPLAFLELLAVVVVTSVAWRLFDDWRRARALPRATARRKGAA